MTQLENGWTELERKLDAVTAERDKLKLDSARLNFIGSKKETVHPVFNQRLSYRTDGTNNRDIVYEFSGWSFGYDNEEFDTPREAIDKAMLQAAQKGE